MNFFERYQAWGQEPTQDIKTLQAIRVNTIKIQPEQLKERLEKKGVKLEPIEKIPYSFRVLETPFSLGACPEYLLGYFSLQEEAAQYSAHLLNPSKDDLVLDMCAAPGNKTQQLSQLMGNEGRLIAFDPRGARLRALHNQLERAGVTNATTFLLGGRQADEINLDFDKILLDAPCSGNFVTDSTWLEKRDYEGVKMNARLQIQLLRTALAILKPGGELIYSTCSLEVEENELIVNQVLDENITCEPIDCPGSEGLTEVDGKQLNAQIKKRKEVLAVGNEHTRFLYC